MMLRDNAKYLLPALCLAIAVPAAFGGSALVDLVASHLSSTYTGGSWSVPDDADIDDGFCPCLTVSDVAVTQDMNGMTTNAVAVSVLSELPAGERGAIFSIYVYNASNGGNEVFAYANGDGTVSLGWRADGGGGTENYATSGALGDYAGLHVWTMLYASGKVAKLYRDGELVLEPDSQFKFTGKKIKDNISFGNDQFGARPLRGMRIYAAHTDFGNGEAIFGKAEESALAVFGTFGFLDDCGGATLSDKLAVFGVCKESGIVGTATLNGVEQGAERTQDLVNLFGSAALSDGGVTFTIGGIDVSDGTLRLDVSPAVTFGNSLSVFGKAALGDRWRRVKVNPEGASVSISDSDFADCRFFQIRAEKGEMSVGYPVSATATVGDSANTDSESHVTSAAVNGDVRLLTLTFDGGEDADYDSRDYETLSMRLDGVRAGTTLRLTVGGAASTAEVGDDGTAVFSGLAGLSRGGVLAVDVVGDSGRETIDATVLSERAGVVSYRWGDGEAEPVDGGVTNAMTMLANKPYGDGLGAYSAGWYRIPAIAKSTNGVVVALYDCRIKNSGDLPNAIDWAENWSGDGGATWTRPRIAVDVPNNGEQTVGRATDITDPCMLYDPQTDRFLAMGITGRGLAGETAENSDVVLYVRGTGKDDAWDEWTGGPEGAGRSVQQMILGSLASVDASAGGDAASIKGILEGPGHGIVQRHTVRDAGGEIIMPAGALVFPMQYFPKGTLYKTFNFAAFSKDGGDTWESTALTPAKAPDGSDCYAQEGSLVELDDGTWEYMGKFGNAGVDVIGKRLFFRTKDFRTWAYDGCLEPSVRAQGSILWLGPAVSNRFDGVSRYAACFSTWGDYAAGKRRGGIKLFFGRDTSSAEDAPGITWDCGELEIRPEHTSACSYNSMVMLDDWTLGVLFEAYGHIYLRKVDVGHILN